MASGSGSANPIQPLSVGNVVSAAFRLYADQIKPFLKISLFATLWVLLPFVVAVGIAFFFGVVQNYYALLGLLIPAWIVLLLYCIAKYLAGSALIARIGFKQLSDQTESLKDAQRYVRSRTWGFLLTSILVSLIYFGIFIVLYIGLAIAGVIMVGAAGGFSGSTSSPNIGVLILFGLLFFVVIIAALVFFCWLGARLAAPELPYAIEPESTAVSTIGRFWDLTKGNAWRVFLVLIVAFLVTLPIQIVAQLMASVAQGVATALVPDSSSPSPTSPLGGASILVAVISYLLSLILSFGLGIFMMPLWQCIKAAIYYDLRSRREGLGLQLRDR